MWTQVNPIDTDLISSNIKDGVDIFGVEGSFEGFLWLETNIILSKANFSWSWCQWAWSILTETVDYIYFIYCSSWPDWQHLWYLYMWHINVAKYNKTTKTLTIIWQQSSGTSFYTSHPTFIWAYQDWNTIYVNMQWYQLVWIFTLNTDTDALWFYTDTSWPASPGWVPYTSWILLTDTIWDIQATTYKLPRDWTQWYNTGWYLWAFLDT